MKYYWVSCTNCIFCFWEGRRSEKALSEPCPRCGGYQFWERECQTKAERQAELLARFQTPPPSPPVK